VIANSYRAVALAAVMLAGFGSASAESGDLIETTYEVNVGGITVLDIKYSVGLSATGYHSQADIETRGVATFFSDYRMKMAVSGSLVDGQAIPAEYTSRRKKNDKTKTWALTWSNNRLSTTGRVKNNKVKAALTPATIDPLTAIFRAGQASKNRPCQVSQRVFDGKEVFDLRFGFNREVNFDASLPGAYRGVTYECLLTYLPVAGKSADKFKKQKENPLNYTVWFARVETDVPGEALLVPVRATGLLDGLEFVAYASRAKIGGRPFNQRSNTGG